MEIKKRSIADAGYDLLLGNEAIVRGAIESNVGFVSIYPGTPISEIGMEIDRNSGEFNIVYEVSVNEKVALESAIGASLSGVRALVAMKHVGLNVASDPLMTLAYIGVRGGLVIITGDDPGCYSSQNEQDNRNYSSFSKVTMLEPSSPEECRMMTKEAFKISEKYNSPVIIRTTTAINHSRGFVSKLSNISKNSNEKGFIKKTNQYVPVPSNARNLHRALVNSINVIQNYADLSELNFHVGSGRLGILTSGYCYNMVMDSLMRLNCEDKFKVYKLGITYPLSELKLLEFVKSVGQVLVIEELSPYLETKLRSIIHKEGLSNKIYGKGFSGLVETGSYSIDQVDDAVREILGWSSITTKSYDVINIIKNIPSRPPILCTGCPHRSTYLTVKFIYRSNAVYSSDIGCYTLGVQEPIEMTDLFTSMGASVSSASGLSLFNDDPVVAFIGDSTFFHSGITGLINAVYNNHNFLLVIMDNEVTAMTGMQNNPGVRLSGRNVNIESIVSGCGVEWCKVIDPNNVQESFRVINESRKVEGIRVIIARSPCALNVMKKPHNEVNYSYRVDTDKCQACHNCSDTTACSTEKSTDYQFTRIDQLLSVEDSNHIKNDFLDKAAPCVGACPVDLCPQGYVTQLASSNVTGALSTIRDQVAMPYSLGAVCHAPCEIACSTTSPNGPIPIRLLKKYAAREFVEYKDDLLQRNRISKIKSNTETIAIVGSGPSGISCAYDLLLNGFRPRIYESEAVAGGMLALGIPSYRLAKTNLYKELEYLQDCGVEFILNTRVGVDVSFEEIQSTHHAVYIATGTWLAKSLDTNVKNIIGGIDFLKNYNSGNELTVHGSAVVIGGGDCAVDVSRVLRRNNVDVIMLVREDIYNQKNHDDQRSAAILDGVNIKYNVQVRNIELINGGYSIEFQEGESNVVNVISSQHIIQAIGQMPEDINVQDLNLKNNNYIEIDKQYRTSIKGVFSGGDVTGRTSTVVDAMGAGKKAAKSIIDYLSCNSVQDAGSQYILTRPSGFSTVLDKSRYIDMDEEESDHISESNLLAASSRCSGCSSCNKCDLCFSELGCPAIDIKKGKPIIDASSCTGCGYCASICPNMAIVKEYDK